VARRRSNLSSRRRSGSLAAFLGRAFKGTAVLVVVAAALAAGYAGASIWKQLQDVPDVAVLERYEPIEAVQILDRNDHLVCTVEGDEDRRVVPLSQVSTQMQQAILAAEDHHFYEHHGINPISIFRALMVNMQAGHVVEGGSTITQQLVKNLFFSETGRTFDRKIKEAFLAWELERRYSKEKILELYLNQVYFGNGAYGVERAAWRYFDKSAARLDLPEAAFLSGLVKAPTELCANRAAAMARQREILDKMVEYGYITADQGSEARGEKLVFKKGSNPLQKYPYYISTVLQILRDRFSSSEMRRQGLRVYTNLDPAAQEAAERVLQESIKKAPKGVSQGALVSVSVQDGSVLALVGGVGDFWKNQWNRATNPHTAGSSFKPFVYLTAFIKGALTPSSVIADEPLVVRQPWGLPDYCPKNFDHKFLGKIPVKRALALSRNVCSVRIAQLVGIDSVVETARLAGITTKLDPNLSLALGSSAVSPLDMAGAYATFARAGVAIKPQLLRRIENNKGQVIETFEPRVDKVFEPEPVAELVDCMQEVVRSGTGTQARLPDRPVAGKTGTADESKDIWFIGFTPDLVTAVWAGNDDNLPIPGTYVTGGTVMAKIWRDYMTAYYDKHPTPPGSFIAPTAASKDEKSPAARAQAPEQGGPLPAPDLGPVEVQPAAPAAATAQGAAPSSPAPSAPLPPPAVPPQTMPPPAPPFTAAPAPAPAPPRAPAPAGVARPAPTLMMQMPETVPSSAPAPRDDLPGSAMILQSRKGVTTYH